MKLRDDLSGDQIGLVVREHRPCLVIPLENDPPAGCIDLDLETSKWGLVRPVNLLGTSDLFSRSMLVLRHPEGRVISSP